MNNEILVSYFSYSLDHRIFKGQKRWFEKLPLSPVGIKSKDGAITYGDYFSFVENYLKRDECKAIKHLHSIIACAHEFAELSEIRIIIVKHGEFYHPSKLEFVYDNAIFSFVVNLAVSEAGMNRIETEFNIFKKLNNDVSFHYIPKAYLIGETAMNSSRKILFFFGEWFENYHEFHVTIDENNNRKTVVWDEKNGNYYLSDHDQAEVYRKASTILTLLYNIDTYEQVFPWHHAAGDFIIKTGDGNGIDVKLITIRQYAPMIENADKEPEFHLLALLVFLVNMSVRMRLDRQDGVGKIVWLEDYTVQSVVDGFFEGLKMKQTDKSIQNDLIIEFNKFISTYEISDLMDMAHCIAESFNQNASEIFEIKLNLESHVSLLYELLVIKSE